MILLPVTKYILESNRFRLWTKIFERSLTQSSLDSLGG